jgi:GWxTD domain-containing protein
MTVRALIRPASRVLLLFVAAAAGCTVFVSPLRDEWYSQHFFIMRDWEKKIYNGLSADGRLEFQKLFWDSRDPESQLAFGDRMEYVSTVYQTENKGQPWNTDRARVYLLNGIPFEIAFRGSETQAKSMPRLDTEYEDIQTRQDEVWSYLYRNRFVYYIFRFSPPSQWRLLQTVYTDTFVAQLENSNRDVFFGVVTDEEQYKLEAERLLEKFGKTP